jgi:hypothetical protein
MTAKATITSRSVNPRHFNISAFHHAQGSGFRVQGSGFRVQGSGFRVQEKIVLSRHYARLFFMD